MAYSKHDDPPRFGLGLLVADAIESKKAESEVKWLCALLDDREAIARELLLSEGYDPDHLLDGRCTQFLGWPRIRVFTYKTDLDLRLSDPGEPVSHALDFLGYARLAREFIAAAATPQEALRTIYALNLGRSMKIAEIGTNLSEVGQVLHNKRQSKNAKQKRGEKKLKATVRRFITWLRINDCENPTIGELLDAMRDEYGAVEQVCYNASDLAPLVVIEVTNTHVIFRPHHVVGDGEDSSDTPCTISTIDNYRREILKSLA